MSELTAILKELSAIREQNRAIIERTGRVEPLWVKASDIMRNTGWNKEGMRKARLLGWVKWFKSEDGIFYDLNSLDKKHYLKQTA
jgi:hypothetical protein